MLNILFSLPVIFPSTPACLNLFDNDFLTLAIRVFLLRSFFLRALKKNDLNRKTLIAKVKKSLSNKFKQAGVDGKITGREKRIFSIYQKMKTKHRSFSDIYDVFAFRVLVDTATIRRNSH